MNRSQKLSVIFFFILLFILIVSSNIELRVCSTCGVQDHNVSVGGKTIEFLSSREYDEFNTHKKWKEVYGKPHKPHTWKLLEEKNRDIIKFIDSL